MKIKRYSLDGLRKLGETLNRLFKKNENRLQPQVVVLPRKKFFEHNSKLN